MKNTGFDGVNFDLNSSWGSSKEGDKSFGFDFGSGGSTIKLTECSKEEYSATINTEFIKEENGQVTSNDTNIYKLGSSNDLDQSRFKHIMEQVTARLQVGKDYVLESVKKPAKTAGFGSQEKDKNTVTINVQFTYTI